MNLTAAVTLGLQALQLATGGNFDQTPVTIDPTTEIGPYAGITVTTISGDTITLKDSPLDEQLTFEAENTGPSLKSPENKLS